MQDGQKGVHVCLYSYSKPDLKITRQSGFNKSKRLLKTKDFKYVLKNGKKHRTPFFLMVCLPNTKRLPRLGITVSKKVSKKAVERNRIKRLIREFFRLNQHAFPKQDFVVIAHPSSSENKALNTELAKIWKISAH